MEHKEAISSHELKSKRLSRIIKEECASDNSETNDESSMSLSELRVKLNPDDNTSVNEWKSRFSDEYSSSKTLSPSAMSSDASSVHSGRFDSEYSVGQRIEVKDYRTDTWYLAKIVEVDYEDREIFIHYERWSQRFDEWLKWDSQRIRKVRLAPSPHRFKMGEHVLATWNYTKKYPAVIKTVYQDDKYEVLFYDGFAKILKGNRISKIDPQEVDLLEKMPKEIPRAPPIGTDLDVRNIGTKEERRQKKRRLNVVELLQSNKRKKGDDIMSSQSCSDTSPEPVARRRYRQRRQLSQPSTSTDKRTSGYSETPKRRNSSVKADENTQGIQELVSVKMEMDDDVNEEKIETDEKSLVLKSDTGISTTVKDNVKDADVKNVNQSIKSEETDEANSSIEKDKDSNSELEFTGFETSPLTIKPKDFEQIRSSTVNPIDTSSPIIKNTNDNDNIESAIQSPIARRISKRGRIPKLKTSLGNLSTTPRLSAFPKIKPRGQIYKTDVKSNRNRFGRKSNVSTSDNETISTSSSQISSTVNASLDSSDKVDNDNVANNDTIGSVNRDSRFSNDTPVNESAMNIGDKGLDSSYGNEDAFSSTSSVAGSVNRRKGRRMKKSLKKLDLKKGKSWKIMSSRRKTDEDDDPERWSGDIPEGAKPVFIDGGDGKMRQSIIIPDKKLPPGWTKHTIIRKNSSKWDVLLVNPTGRKFRSRKDLRTYYNELNKDYPEDCFDFVVGRTKATSILIEMETLAKKQMGPSPPTVKTPNKKRDSRKSGSDDSFTLSPSQVVIPDGEKRVKTLMPKTKPTINTNVEEEPSTPSVATVIPTSVPIATTSTSLSNLNTPPLSPISAKSIPVTTPLTPKVPTENVPVSGIGSPLTPDPDGTASWICPKEGCGKHFRKENLLQMHFKHYHPEYNQFLEGAPNVADLAYARTIGEPLDDTVGVTSFLDRIKIYEARRKAKTDKTNIAGSPLRKALLKGFPTSKESPEHSDCGDIVMKIDTSPGPLQNKLTESSEQNGLIGSSSGGGGDAERILHESPEKGKLQNGVEDHEKVYNDISSNHPTLKELLTGTSNTDPIVAAPDITTLPSSPPDSLAQPTSPICLKPSTEPAAPINPISVSTPSIHKISGPSIDESAPNSPATPTTSGIKHVMSNPSSYRFSRIKPFVSVEKLNVTTDSNGRVLYMDKKVREITKLTEKQADSLPDIAEHDLSADVPNCAEAEPDDMLKKEEIINCLCGYAEEDGLMIQCDLCLCWQHGFCNNIKKESDVPEKYICSICRNPKKLRNSYKYSYNFDWLKEGKLPNLSFRTQNKNEIQQRESLLKRSHDLVATLLQLQTVVKSLRLKTHIAGKSDHPKLYLWAKSWEKETKADAKVKMEDKGIGNGEEDKKENEIKKEKENVEDSTPKGPQAPVPEAPIDLVECRLRLLEHIEDYQQQVESRLTTIEAQVVALESQDSDVATDETPDDYSQTKQTVQMLMRDLGTVRKVIGLN